MTADGVPGRKRGKPFAIWCAPETSSLFEEAARLSGMSAAEWARNVLRHDAIRTLIASRNRPCRLRPGYVVHKIASRLDATEPVRTVPMFVASGKEECWVLDVVYDAPDTVQKDGRAYIVDLIRMGISNAVVASNAVVWAGVQPIEMRAWPMAGTTRDATASSQASPGYDAPGESHEEAPSCPGSPLSSPTSEPSP